MDCKIRLGTGSYAKLLIRSTRSMQDTETKQIKVSASIRFALEQFQPIHLTFGLPIAEARGEGRPNRVVIAVDASGKAAKFSNGAVLDLNEPGFQH